MKDKKSQQNVVTVSIIMILLVLAIIMVFYWVIDSILKPQFTIYKKECKNESNYQDLIDSNCLINSSLKEDYVEYTIICPQCYNEDCDYEIKTHEVCEQVEVISILIPVNECMNICDVPLGEACPTGCKIIIENNISSLYRVISKKDLTKEWLNNNCEFCCENWCVDINQAIAKADFDNCKNKTWRCFENYFVEVK